MIQSTRTRIIFKTIAGLMACVFLWQQISWAGDLIDYTIDKLNAEQSQTFAPAYLQQQQSISEDLVAQKQAVEDTINLQNLTAQNVSDTTQASSDDSIELQGPKGGSGEPATTTIMTMTESSTPQEEGAVLSITTETGDVIHYKGDQIESIVTKDSENKKIVIKRIEGLELVDTDNNLLNAEITYADGTIQLVAGGKVSRITKPDGAIINYNNEERIESIIYTDNSTATYTYTKDSSNNIIETVVSSDTATLYYDDANKLKKAIKSNGTIIDYNSGRIDKVGMPDGKTYLYTYTQTVTDSGVVYNGRLDNSLDPSEISISYTYDENGKVASTEFTLSDGTKVRNVVVNPDTGLIENGEIKLTTGEILNINEGKIVGGGQGDIIYNEYGFPLTITSSDKSITNTYSPNGDLEKREISYMDGSQAVILYSNGLFSNIEFTDPEGIISYFSFSGNLLYTITLDNRNIDGFVANVTATYDSLGSMTSFSTDLESGMSAVEIGDAATGFMQILNYDSQSVGYRICDYLGQPLLTVIDNTIVFNDQSKIEEENMTAALNILGGISGLEGVSSKYVEDLSNITTLLNSKLSLLSLTDSYDLLSQQYNSILTSLAPAQANLNTIVAQISGLQASYNTTLNCYNNTVTQLSQEQSKYSRLLDTYNSSVAYTQACLNDLNSAINALNQAQVNYDSNISGLTYQENAKRTELAQIQAQIDAILASGQITPEEQAIIDQRQADLNAATTALTQATQTKQTKQTEYNNAVTARDQAYQDYLSALAAYNKKPIKKNYDNLQQTQASYNTAQTLVDSKYAELQTAIQNENIAIQNKNNAQTALDQAIADATYVDQAALNAAYAQRDAKQQELNNILAQEQVYIDALNNAKALKSQKESVYNQALTNQQTNLTNLNNQQALLNTLTSQRDSLSQQLTNLQSQIDQKQSEKTAAQTIVNNLTADKVAKESEITAVTDDINNKEVAINAILAAIYNVQVTIPQDGTVPVVRVGIFDFLLQYTGKESDLTCIASLKADRSDSLKEEAKAQYSFNIPLFESTISGVEADLVAKNQLLQYIASHLDSLTQAYNSILTSLAPAQANLNTIVAQISGLQASYNTTLNCYNNTVTQLSQEQSKYSRLLDTYNSSVAYTQACLNDLNSAINALNQAQVNYDSNISGLTYQENAKRTELAQIQAQIDAILASGQITPEEQAIIDQRQADLNAATTALTQATQTKQTKQTEYNNAVTARDQAYQDYLSALAAYNKKPNRKNSDNLQQAEATYNNAQTLVNSKYAELQIAIQNENTAIQNKNNAQVALDKAIADATYVDQAALNAAYAQRGAKQQELNNILAQEQVYIDALNNTQNLKNQKEAIYNQALVTQQTNLTCLNNQQILLNTITSQRDSLSQELTNLQSQIDQKQSEKVDAQTTVNNLTADKETKELEIAAKETECAQTQNDIIAAEERLADLNELYAYLLTLPDNSSISPEMAETILGYNYALLPEVDASFVSYDESGKMLSARSIKGALLTFNENGLIDNISKDSVLTYYNYALTSLDNIEEISVNRDGIKRIYDKYGDIKSLSLDDATQIIYENGQVKEIKKADGTVIKNMTFRESGELDSTLISYPDGSIGIYNDSELLQLISASNDITEYRDGKIRKVTLSDGAIYDWSYEGGNIIILDNARQEKRTYLEGRLIQLEELARSRITTKYYYNLMGSLARSEVCKDADVLYTYTYAYENNLTLVHDEDGNVQAYTKDKKLSYIIDSQGRKYSYTYVGKSEGYIEVYFPSGVKARYDAAGFIIDITQSDGAVIKDIALAADNTPEDFTYIKDGVTYKVDDRVIAEVLEKDGTNTIYYDNDFIQSVTEALGELTEYQYYVEDSARLTSVSTLSTGIANNISLYEQNSITRLALSDASFKFGTGIDGAKHVTSDETLIAGTYNFTSLTVDAGKTLKIAPGAVINVLGTAAVSGAIFCGGAFTMNTYDVNVASSASITGDVNIKCNTINNAGIITGNAAMTGTLTSGANEADRDDNFSASSHAFEYNVSGSGGVTSIITFPAGHISYIRASASGNGNAGHGEAYFYIRVNGEWRYTGAGGAGTGNPGWSFYVYGTTHYDNGGAGWDNADAIMASVSAYGAGGVGRAYMQEMQAIIGTPTIEYASGNPGIVNTSESRPVATQKQIVNPASGSFESAVMELNALTMGSLSWSQETPAGTAVTFQTRTGDTATPDATWTDWSAPLTDPGGSAILSPGKKYVQHRITLTTADPSETPKIIINTAQNISISYTRISDDPLDPYVKVKTGGITKTYNRNGVNIADPADMIDINSLKFDSTYINTLKDDIPTHKLSDAQKVITLYDEGNDIPVEIVAAGQSITYFDQGFATKVVDKNGATQVLYTYDEDKNVIKVEFVEARQKLEENYQNAVAEIETDREAALAKIAQAEADAYADIVAKSADIQSQISTERMRLQLERSMYAPNIYDLSEFGRAFREIDDYEAQLQQQTQNAYEDLDEQVEAACARIETDAATAMQDLIDNDYNKILADIVQKESSPLIYQYYRKVLGRDPGDDDLLYWTNIAKTELKPITAAELTQYIENLSEYLDKLTRKQNIIANVTSFFAQYFSAPEIEKETMLFSLGFTSEEASNVIQSNLAQTDVDVILAWLNSQSLHFGDSAFKAIISLLQSSDINKTFEDIGKDAIKIDILAGIITKDNTGDLLISMYAMRKAAEINGLTLYPQKISYNALKDQVSRNNVIVHIDGKHYVLVTSINDTEGTVTYIDPTVGQNGQEMTLSRAEFMGKWKGYSLSKELPADPAKQLNVTQEKNIRGSGWWEDFWKGICNFFQKIVAPVATILLMIPPLAPIGAIMLGINIVIQTISFVVRTGTLMDVVWSVVNTIGAAIGATILPGIYEAAGQVFSSIGQAIFAPLQGVFSAVMPIFNNLSMAVSNIATGIGHIVSLGAASTEIAASIGYNVITQGVSLGTDFLFRSLNLDPSLAHIGSALFTGAVMGVISPDTNIIAEAVRYGTIAGVDEIGEAIDLDPNITHLAAMMSGSLVGGALTINGREISYTELMQNIAPNIASECAYISLTEIGELLGIDPRISYLAGVGIRSTINAGLTHDFKPGVIWGSVTQGLLQGITSVALQWGAEELGLSPLIGSLTSAAIAGGLEALLMGQNPVQGIYETYFRAGTGLLTLGYDGSNNPWLRAAYISQVLDFSRIIQERGIANALETYAAGFLHQQTINEIWKQGGIAQLLTEPNQVEYTTDRKGRAVKRIYTMVINSENDKLLSNYIDLSPTYDMLVGFREGNVITHCEFVIGPDGKPQFKNGEREIFNQDGSGRVEYVENFNLAKIEYYDSGGNKIGYSEPLIAGSSIMVGVDNNMTSGKFVSLITDYSVSTKDSQVTDLSFERNCVFGEADIVNLLNLGIAEQDIPGFKEVVSIVNGVVKSYILPPNTALINLSTEEGRAWREGIEARGQAFWGSVYGLYKEATGGLLPEITPDSVYPYATIDLNLPLPGGSEAAIAALDFLYIISGNTINTINPVSSLITANSTWNHNTSFSAQLYAASFDMGYKLVFGGGANTDGLTQLEREAFYYLLDTDKVIGVGNSADSVSMAKSWLISDSKKADHYFLTAPRLSPDEMYEYMQIGGINPNQVTVVETVGDFPPLWSGKFSDNKNADGSLKWNYVKILSGSGVSWWLPSHGVPVRGLLDGGLYTVEVNGVRQEGVTLADIYKDQAN